MSKDVAAMLIKRDEQQHIGVKLLSLQGSLLSSSSLLQCQVNDCTIVHVVISQRVGILDENALITKDIAH